MGWTVKKGGADYNIIQNAAFYAVYVRRKPLKFLRRPTMDILRHQKWHCWLGQKTLIMTAILLRKRRKMWPIWRSIFGVSAWEHLGFQIEQIFYWSRSRAALTSCAEIIAAYAKSRAVSFQLIVQPCTVLVKVTVTGFCIVMQQSHLSVRASMIMQNLIFEGLTMDSCHLCL